MNSTVKTFTEAFGKFDQDLYLFILLTWIHPIKIVPRFPEVNPAVIKDQFSLISQTDKIEHVEVRKLSVYQPIQKSHWHKIGSHLSLQTAGTPLDRHRQ